MLHPALTFFNVSPRRSDGSGAVTSWQVLQQWLRQQYYKPLRAGDVHPELPSSGVDTGGPHLGQEFPVTKTGRLMVSTIVLAQAQ